MTSLPDPLRSRAVLIGVGDYRKLSNLPAVHKNLVALGEMLRDDRFWGLPRNNCILVDGPETAAEMLDPVVEAADAATDTLLLYYAGHGLVDRRSELHLALVGSDPQRIYTSVPYNNVRDALLDSRATRRLVILDCCYSGRALGQMSGSVSAVVEEASVEGTYILAAAAENRTALAPPGQDYTAFTGELLDIIHNGISGCGQFLDLDSIYQHLLAGMREKGFPVPQKRDRNTAGRLTLVRNQAFGSESSVINAASEHELEKAAKGVPPLPEALQAEPLPEDLRRALESPDRQVRKIGVYKLAALLDLDVASPGLALAARQALERIAETDDTQVAALALMAVAAPARTAADKVFEELFDDQANREARSHQDVQDQTGRRAEHTAGTPDPADYRSASEELERRIPPSDPMDKWWGWEPGDLTPEEYRALGEAYKKEHPDPSK